MVAGILSFIRAKKTLFMALAPCMSTVTDLNVGEGVYIRKLWYNVLVVQNILIYK